MSDLKHVWVGMGVFVFRDGKFLMLKRKGKHAPGTWSVPGGWQEIGETFEQASKREIKEEVGCEITNVRFGAVTNNHFPEENIHSVSVMTISDWFSGEPQNLESEKCEELRWVDFDNLPSPLFRAWEDLLKSEFLNDIKQELDRSKR
jgi:8-oxo-dGTP diphosphatase